MADHKYEKWIQKDDAIIDGIDVSGEWNKMYEPREIMDYDLTYMDKVTELDVVNPWAGVTSVHSVLAYVL